MAHFCTEKSKDCEHANMIGQCTTLICPENYKNVSNTSDNLPDELTINEIVYVRKGEETMREILFRAKRVDNGEWVYGFYTNHCVDHLYIARIERMTFSEYGEPVEYITVDNKTVGQFTGLTDKSGKKIFEGDIVQAPSNLAGTEFYIGAIEFGNFDDYNGNIYTGFFIRWHNVPQYSTLRQSIVWWRDEKDRFLEVIGNIFDNPELLEVE